MQCNNISFLPDISKWNTDNIINFDFLFTDCISLKELPDISKWNTSNVKNMAFLFYRCSSLKELPDISKWDTRNVKDINSIFLGCSSLKQLPDISKWNASNFKYINHMFGGDPKYFIDNLLSYNIMNLPYKIIEYISLFFPNYNKKIENLDEIIPKECSSLTSLPDISNWDTHNVINMSSLFSLCSSLKNLPDI